MNFKDCKRIFHYIGKYKLKVFWLVVCMVASQSCALVLPYIMSKIVDIGIKRHGFEPGAEISGFSAEQLVSNQTAYILQMGLQMLFVVVISALFSVISGRIMAKVSELISSDMRRDVFFTILDMPSGDAGKLSVSSLITRATNDIEHVKSLLLTSIHILMPPFMALGGIYMVLITCAKMSWIMALGSALSVLAVVICLKLAMPKLRLVQLLNDKFNMIVRERLSGLVVTRIFDNNEYEYKKFQKCNQEFTDISFYVSKVFAFVMPVLSTIMNIVNVLIIWLGANEISKASMQVGDVMALMQYSVLVIMAFLMFSLIISNIPKAWISVERVTEILKLKELGCGEDTNSVDFMGERIEFKDVWFRYEGAEDYAVKHVNLEVTRGEKIGILGATGCGKSTIFKLLLGEYRPTRGKILIDGTDISKVTSESLTNVMGYVPQEPLLFEGTVADNMRLGSSEISDECIFKALNAVQLGYLANSGGINKKIEYGGSNFSGGERQRLTIARALVSDKAIYILDDSFSKLDFRTDKRVREELFKIAEKRILFVVSQRMSAIKDCDKIIVMEDGEISAFGTHDKLLGESEFYSKIARLQLGGDV